MKKSRTSETNAAADHRPVAVALGFNPDEDAAPKVVAGGRGDIAEQILEVAFRHGIKVREDANLAELLSAIDIESDIPAEAFAAVAEILVYVYRANSKLETVLTALPEGSTTPSGTPASNGTTPS